MSPGMGVTTTRVNVWENRVAAPVSMVQLISLTSVGNSKPPLGKPAISLVPSMKPQVINGERRRRTLFWRIIDERPKNSVQLPSGPLGPLVTPKLELNS